MHASGIIAGWHYRKWFRIKKLPKQLIGKPKVIVPPEDAPECLRHAFWAGYTSDFLDASVTRQHWQNARTTWQSDV